MCPVELVSAISLMSAKAIAATTLAITTISAGVSVAQQQANAKAQAKYQNAQFKATKEAATANAITQYNALQTRQQQETAAAAQAIDMSSMRAAQAASTARVTAGETGTGGASIDALLNEYRRQELGFAQNTIRNQTWQNAQIQLNMEGIRANQQAQIAAATPRPVEQPDYIGAALRIGAGALDAMGTYGDITYKQTGVYPGSNQYTPGYGMAPYA
jgi:hypothetical protein